LRRSSASARCRSPSPEIKRGRAARPTPLDTAQKRYCDFFAGSWVVEDEELPLGELLGEALLPDAPALGEELLEPPLAEPELEPEPVLESLELGVDALGEDEELELELGEDALGDELLGDELLGEELAPPEAEPELDFDASLEPDPLMPPEELDEELGLLGDEEAPLEGDELGEDAVLELDEPGLDEVLLESPPRSHAASPKARATAAARIESLMCPPWVGTGSKRQGISY